MSRSRKENTRNTSFESLWDSGEISWAEDGAIVFDDDREQVLSENLVTAIR